MEPSPAVPQPVADACERLLTDLDRHAPGLIDGLYVHGSLCWGEYFPSSDIDLVATVTRPVTDDDCATLNSVYSAVEQAHGVTLEALHCTVDDLRRPPGQCPPSPYYNHGSLTAENTDAASPVTWHELAERGITLRGPNASTLGIHTDLTELWRYCQHNLATYWAHIATRLREADDDALARDDAPLWCALGVARVHHVLTRDALTSKSGAAFYMLEEFDLDWHPLATEALRLRERPDAPSLYDDLVERGRQTRAFVDLVVQHGATLDAPGQRTPTPPGHR